MGWISRAARTAKSLWNWLSHGSTAWGLLPPSWQAAFSTGLGAVTGYLGYQPGGIAWAIFLATGVFAFTMVGLDAIIRVGRASTVFQHLTVPRVEIMDAGVLWNEEHRTATLVSVTLSCAMKNESERPLFLRVRRISHSFEGKTTRQPYTPDQPVVVPSRAEQQFTFATISDPQGLGTPSGERTALKGWVVCRAVTKQANGAAAWC